MKLKDLIISKEMEIMFTDNLENNTTMDDLCQIMMGLIGRSFGQIQDCVGFIYPYLNSDKIKKYMIARPTKIKQRNVFLIDFVEHKQCTSELDNIPIFTFMILQNQKNE